MAKLPAIQFYTGDWLKDPALSRCLPSTRGIWIDALCAMHESDRSDSLSGTPDQLARVLRCTPSDVLSAIDDLRVTGAAAIRDSNGVVTLTSRRFQRERRERVMTRKRVKKHRGNGDETDLKRSGNDRSSSSISSSEEKARAAPDVPPELDIPEFKQAWAEYVQYRKRSHLRSLQPPSIAKQFTEFIAWGGARPAIEAIDLTIRQGWHGIFRPDEGRNGKHETVPNREEPRSTRIEF